MSDILVPVSPEDLTLLGWFASWTPGVHRADWQTRRRWPPGFREIADLSAYSAKSLEDAERRLCVPPNKRDKSRVRDLLAYRLVEGTWSCARLTPRGRAALKLAQRPCPDFFASHAPDVFDDHPLAPHHEEAEDCETFWRELLVEYQDDDYRGRHTLTAATAQLSSSSSTGAALNGSLRTHNRFLHLTVTAADHRQILDLDLSFEQLAELLTSHMATPVTLGGYFGADGMRRSEPAPPPVSAKRRMLERLDGAEEGQEDVLRKIADKIRAGNIGKRLQEELLRDIDIAIGNGAANRAFVVTQALEEMSVVAEGALSIAADRLAAAGVDIRSLPAASAVLELAGVDSDV